MAKQKDFNASENDSLDIDALLNKIDSLVSVSGDAKPAESSHDPDTEVPEGAPAEGEGFTPAQLEEISKGTAQGLPVEIYANKEYNWLQMYEIRLGLLEHLNVEYYLSPHYSVQQMHEIRLGLLDGLDVSSYATLVLSATNMRDIRKRLFAHAYKSNPNSFERWINDDETGILLHISADYMSAYLCLPENSETDFSVHDLLQVLENHEIVEGILHENLRKIVKDKPGKREILVARGKPPIIGEAGRYELFFENGIEKGHTVPPDGEIDYTDVNTVDAIKPGDKLVKYHPAQKDTGGVTVTGITVEGTPGEDLPVLTGRGFRYDPNSGIYTATEKGYASYNDSISSLNVWNVYVVPGDVCYYQSIEYDGAVHVCGSVRSMSTIRAAGDVIIDGFMENATVISESNVVIKGGANGGGQGRVEAGGSIRASFFENIDVVAKGMVESNYFFNANIDTEDRVVARGRKARIIGGRISASLSVDAIIAGNYLSSKTLFNIGDIHSLEKRMSPIAIERKAVLEELQQLTAGQQKLLDILGEDQAKGNALYTKTCAALHTKELQLESLDREITRIRTIMRRAENAYIKIHGQLQSDVIFIINNVRKETPTPLGKSVYLTKKDCLRPRK